MWEQRTPHLHKVSKAGKAGGCHFFCHLHRELETRTRSETTKGKKQHDLQSMQFLKTEKIKIDSQRMAVLRHVPPISLHTFPVLRSSMGLKSSQTQAWLKPREFSTISFTHPSQFNSGSCGRLKRISGLHLRQQRPNYTWSCGFISLNLPKHEGSAGRMAPPIEKVSSWNVWVSPHSKLKPSHWVRNHCF